MSLTGSRHLPRFPSGRGRPKTTPPADLDPSRLVCHKPPRFRRRKPVKRFEFSLDRLLKVKRQLERLAELEQHRAREAVDRARAVLEDLRAQLNRVSEQFAASVGRPMAA